MNIRELQKDAHTISKDLGWWDDERTFGDLIALVHSELSEALEAYRERRLESWETVTPILIDDIYSGAAIRKPEGVASELADVVIRVADMAEHYGVDVNRESEGLIYDLLLIEACDQAKSFGDWIALSHAFAAQTALVFTGWNGVVEHVWAGELAAVLYIIRRMAAHYGIDLDAAIETKMAYNRTRSHRHGGKAL